MNNQFYEHIDNELQAIKSQGLYKDEREILTPQETLIDTQSHQQVINFCANNYLGLANHPLLIQKAQNASKRYGYGMASVRFICGTQSPHCKLESKLSQFLNKDDSILYSSCFDANTGLFETLLGPEDAIISDSLNHASIIDGIRLCKASRFRYKNNDMADLKKQLEEAQSSRFKLIATDGVFSMDGVLANLPDICELAEQYNALIMVDDSHAFGFMGPEGQGTPHHFGVSEKIDIVTGTLGKALGGASGGFTSAAQPIVSLLRQRSRPYLFSNALCPIIAETSLTALDLIKVPELRQQLQSNSIQLKSGLEDIGYTLIQNDHPITPVMLGDASVAAQLSRALLDLGVYVIGFSYPVVPKNKARIRVQLSAAHSEQQIKQAIDAFSRAGKELGII